MDARKLMELIGVVAEDRRVVEAYARIAAFGPSPRPIVLLAPTGCGKEMAARALAIASGRERFIVTNCAAIPDALIESELFGHVRGAFTGATRDRAGAFEAADGGTLFLDEIGELPVGLQPKLLRALQEGEVQRVGSDEPIKVNVRVVAATNRDLRAEVKAGRFRADLLYRFPLVVELPALRERTDLALVAADRLARIWADDRCDGSPPALDAAVLAELAAREWPGNVRELEGVLAEAVAMRDGRPIRPEDVSGVLTKAEQTAHKSGAELLTKAEQPRGASILEVARLAVRTAGVSERELARRCGWRSPTKAHRFMTSSRASSADVERVLSAMGYRISVRKPRGR